MCAKVTDQEPLTELKCLSVAIRPPACDWRLKRTEREMASRYPSERNSVKPTREKSDDMS